MHVTLIAGIKRALQPILPEGLPARADSVEVRVYREPVVERWVKIVDARAGDRYGGDIDYAMPLDPPLGGEDGRWAAELLKGVEAKRK